MEGQPGSLHHQLAVWLVACGTGCPVMYSSSMEGKPGFCCITAIDVFIVLMQSPTIDSIILLDESVVFESSMYHVGMRW